MSPSPIFRAVPLGVALWLLIFGVVFVSPWLLLASGIMLALGVLVLLEGSCE